MELKIDYKLKLLFNSKVPLEIVYIIAFCIIKVKIKVFYYFLNEIFLINSLIKEAFAKYERKYIKKESILKISLLKIIRFY